MHLEELRIANELLAKVSSVFAFLCERRSAVAVRLLVGADDIHYFYRAQQPP
jgi:hypothetical protein